MCDDDFDSPVDLASQWRRARKEHVCIACRETVRIGDRYHIEVQKYDDLRTFKHCARCWAIVEAILDAGAGSVRWDLNCGLSWEEALGDLPESVAALAFLTPDEAQQRLAEKADA